MLVFKRLLSTTLVKRKYSPTDQLDSLYKLSTLVNNTPSTLEKHAFLREYTACHSTLKRIYDPHLRHYLSAKLVINYLEIHPELAATKPIYSNLDRLLDALSSRAITGYTARGAVASFYTTYCKTQEQQNIFWRIIDRNLKMGVSVKTIRHQLSNDPSETLSRASSNISVALASTVSNKKKNLFDLKLDDWYVSQKLDGIRCVAIIRPKQDDRNQYDIQFYSRTGRPFTSLHKVKVDIEKRLDSLSLKDEFVLDGEVCAYNAQDTENENFNKALSQVRRANEEMENPVYQVFDRICLQSFLETKGDQLFSTRQELLKTFIGNSSIQHIKLVKQTKLENLEQLNGMKEQAVQKGWEGLILRKDAPYEGKRTRNMLKLKEWEDAEYIVNSIETGMMRMPDTGEDKLVVTNVNIEHKGNTVSVGSGFSMQNRISYAENPDLIIGKPITVRYFSESKKEDGSLSLRFPSVKVVYEEGKRDV